MWIILIKTECVKQTADKDENRHTRYPREGFAHFLDVTNAVLTVFQWHMPVINRSQSQKQDTDSCGGQENCRTGVIRRMKFTGTRGISYVPPERNKYQPSVSMVILNKAQKVQIPGAQQNFSVLFSLDEKEGECACAHLGIRSDHVALFINKEMSKLSEDPTARLKYMHSVV